jgi:hypothetical protein
MDMRLLEMLERDVRPETTDDEDGDVERGVEMSELEVL